MPDLHPDISPRPAQTAAATLTVPAAQLARASLAGALCVALAAFALAGPAFPAIATAVAGYLVAAALAVAALRRDFPHRTLGACNRVTLARMALTSALLAPLVADASGWAVLATALTVLCLDGVDGWLARRTGHVSDFGARFDMEVDAALGLILALNAWAADTAPAAVLLLGLPRYVFVAAARFLPWLARPLPESFGRKAVCVLQIAALITLQVPGLPPSLAGGLVAVTGVALCASFGRDVLWLRRARS